MEGRIKKLFHRKTRDSQHQDDDDDNNDDHDDNDELQQQQQQSPPQQRDRRAIGGANDSPLRGSAYETAIPGGPPETGTYPIRGNANTSPVVGRGNPTRSAGQQRASADTSFNQNYHQHAASPPTRRPITAPGNGSSDPYNSRQPGLAMSTGDRGGGRASHNDGDLSQAFSNLDLRTGEDSRSSTQPQVPSYGQNTYGAPLPSADVNNRNARDASRGNLQYSYLPTAYRESSNQARHVEGADRTVPGGPRALKDSVPRGNAEGQNNNGSRSSPYSAEALYDSAAQQAQEESDLTRRTSIPRKMVRASPTNPSAGTFSTSHQQSPPSQMRQSSLHKPLPTAPPATRDGYQDSAPEEHRSHRPSNDLRPIPLSEIHRGNKLTGDDVVARASSNTYDTEVIETIAPAVVHETINRDIHHVRQEVITREIRNHDVYHRILPVIDVEVLPPRHFLPVEGGGLVEIGADEVPGRGNNWVIAETASKIPSDEPAPETSNRFSAREFVGTEGDSKRYMTREGYERTEQTWVHHPELETGGRDSGQTWPMVFADADEEDSRATPTSKVPKQKSSRKHRQNQSTDQSGTGGGGRIQPAAA